MNVAFDIDGTITNFEDFILKNKKYVEKKYGLTLSNSSGYDIDEMFQIRLHLMEQGIPSTEAIKQEEKIVNSFWNKYYIKYLLTSFRKDVAKTVSNIKKRNGKVIMITSRKHACEKNFVGYFVRYSTILSLKLRNIKYDNIVFLPSDDVKIDYILNHNIDIMFDDKPYIINAISEQVKCVCIDSHYNRQIDKNIDRIYDYSDNKQMNHLLDEKISESKLQNVNLYPNIKKTEKNYKIVRTIGSPFVKFLFKPIILNEQNLSTSSTTIYAPNHRKTLDPFFIVMSIKEAIHWAALQRFFTGEDSIFNNSKNPLLCKLTAKLFKEMGLVPVNRGGDNTHMKEIFDYYLQNRCNVGIFPEGTTNKHPEISELLEIKNGAFYFAKNNDAIIQPISIIWFPRIKYLKNNVIINYGKPFSMKDISLTEGKEKWRTSILEGIKESKVLMQEILDKEETKKKIR